jgi:hypothetical protein
MDCTTFVLALIKAYKTEHNRMKRAQAKKTRIFRDRVWTNQMSAHDFSSYFYHDSTRYKPTSYHFKRARKHFHDLKHQETLVAFVSNGVKRAAIREQELELARLRNRFAESVDKIVIAKTKLAQLKKVPVLAALGKTWQLLIDAYAEEYKAHEDRWKARCAIYAFNKMNMGIQIKFGHCRGSGSMSTINHVVIDGDKIPLKKFLENAEFESVVLNAPNPNV